ncbi:RNA polymerase sigma factor [Humisphaera borealis]|uniref:Sigma-70 family RNA polymerase sigma factor n=1 Tax=Humisphaera borealis TaxID=2807512 RepID=A0A7M2WYM2_9BACT|nr:sigma-70 family RNA polymerase sigma factor [Humisphaera borealis]QOV90598.1 sigma-70 family RNA polymerase sigma factor [Humisphaera borealis]
MDADLAETLEALHADSFGWALHCCRGDRCRAEDVLQTAYLKLAEARCTPPDDRRSALKTWWFGVIRLTAMEDHRTVRSRRSLLERLLGRAASRPEAVEISPEPTPPMSAQRNEQDDLLRRSLGQLSPRQAEVLHLTFYQGMTIGEAADVMGVGIGSARQHYERGKSRLRELLEKEACDANHA